MLAHSFLSESSSCLPQVVIVQEHGQYSLQVVNVASLKSKPGIAGACCESIGLLEVRERHEVVIVGGGLPARIRHREQCDLVSTRAHQLDGFKQIRFGSAEPEVVLVAVQDFHD